MSYVPGFRNDLFVSYAHVDDQPLAGVEQGWVTTLVENLRTQLVSNLGRADDFALWMDHGLQGNQPLTPAILDAVGQSAILLVVLSPGYMASPWCQRELNTFLQGIQQRLQHRPRSVFVVQRNKIDQAPPDALKDLLFYKFWSEDPLSKRPRVWGMPRPDPNGDKEYWGRFNDLCCDLKDELCRLRDDGGAVPPPPDPGSPVVFLAEVTDDLDTQRDEVARYLKQARIRTLPETFYSRDPAKFAAGLEADLAQSKVFVQLLSASPGKKTQDLPQGYVGLQVERARASQKEILQWRSANADVASVQDAAHRAILEGESVLVMGFEEFKARVVERAKAKPMPAPMPSLQAFVFVDLARTDRELVSEMTALLRSQGVGYSLRLEQGTPEELREDLETNLSTCDALLIVYGRTTAAWVRQQLLQARKLIAKRDAPLRSLAIYEGPPPAKDSIDLDLPNLTTIRCRAGFDPTALNEFLAALRSD